MLVIFFTLIPIMSVPIFVLAYYSFKVRKEQSVASRRAGLLSLGGFALATAYVVELLGVDPWITAGVRSLFAVSSFLFYYALFMLKEKVE